jgi:putative DNA primase/helicase
VLSYEELARAAVAAIAKTPDLLGQLHNDHGNSERLIALHGRDLRYCYPFRKWLVWDGKRWAVDDEAQVRKLAKRAMLEFLGQAVERRDQAGERFAKQSLEDRRVGGMLSMAQCELPVKPEHLDTDPHLLNFLNGTVDLRTGEIHEAERGQFITKLIHHRYEPGAGHPRFDQFLGRILPARLADWMQKAIGYSLTGTTSEKAVFLLHGPKDTGKTTLLTLFLRLLWEYAVLLQIDTLMVRQESNNTQADLADLRGARFAMTSETEEGQRLAEGKLKRITQGMGLIKATRKYENPITFGETHKLWIDANHRPVVRGTDDAIWGRLKPIPFEVVIPKDEIDRNLPGELFAEAEGILAWGVAGAVRWFAEGLDTPAEVERATEAWRADMDQVGRFIAESCVVGDGTQAKARHLYANYKAWTENAGEHPLRESAFAGRIVERGFEKTRRETGFAYLGLGVRDERL